MHRQNRVAHQHDYSFLRTSSEVRRFVDLGLLVRLRGNGNYTLASVSHPYARPAVKVFVERLSAQYVAACGEKLVVTSLTRPEREQPRNASDLSVHPAGMAVDLRISRRRTCRSWLERTLLQLEKQGLLDAGRERRPPHYHVALFPEAYTRHVARVAGRSAPVRVARATGEPARATPAVARPAAAKPAVVTASTANVIPPLPAPIELTIPPPVRGATVALEPAAEAGGDGANVAAYRTRRGDSLWSIARRHGTTVETLRALNGLKGSQIVAGQVINVPVSVGADGS